MDPAALPGQVVCDSEQQGLQLQLVFGKKKKRNKTEKSQGDLQAQLDLGFKWSFQDPVSLSLSLFGACLLLG